MRFGRVDADRQGECRRTDERPCLADVRMLRGEVFGCLERVARLGKRLVVMRFAHRLHGLAEEPHRIEVAPEDIGRSIRARRQRREQRLRPLQTGDRPFAIAQIRRVGPALHDADLEVRAAELQLQLSVACRITRQPFKVLEAFRHDRLSNGRRTSQRRHRVVDIEDDRVGKLPHVVEPPLCPLALDRGGSRLPHGDAKRGDHEHR